jgi:glyoxylase-like metal-dependent hydrolase (beta-lactamase superfamily II)
MDVSLSGGEKVRIRDDWELEVLHVPGHSHGHLALYDRKNRAAYVGDAIHGRGCPKAEGGLAMPVTYHYVDIYLSTLRYFEGLDLDVLYSGHWPIMHREAIRDFIAESRQTVELLDRVIFSSLARNPAGLTLEQLIDAVANAVGDWPTDSWTLAMFPVKGHMDRLEQQGKVQVLHNQHPVRWQTDS